MSEEDEIILLKPILVESGTDPKCVNDDEPYKNFTDPILGGSMPSSTTPLVGPYAGSGLPTLTGDNVFNVYQAVGVAPNYSTPRIGGQIKFGVTPCAEKIDIRVVGRADIYDSSGSFDTLEITIDGTQVARFATVGGGSGPPFDGTTTYDTTVTHNFTEPKACGHIVDISGLSGNFANNNVGYDVKITVTLRTTPI